MIITQIRLVAVGRHPSISFDSNAPVVGLLGPNGSGKSTVLEMIKFAFTGETEDNIDTYVRYGEGNASVEIDFIKNGQKGTIFRQFGKVNKRKLTWDGKEIKSAKEVEATMAGIFAADKKAIANAVFIRQGMLEQILFSGDADRRSLFIKLVNMAFCVKRASAVQIKIRKLEADIVDLGPMIQTLTTQRELAESATNKAQTELDAMKDYSIEIAFCEAFATNQDLFNRVVVTIGQVESERIAYQAEVDRLLGLLGVKSIEAATEENKMKSVRLQLASSAVTNFESISTELTHFDRVTNEAQEIKTRLDTALREIRELNPINRTQPQLEAEYQRVSKQALLYSWRRETEQTLNRWKTYVQQTNEAIAAQPRPSKPESELTSLRSLHAKLISRIEMVKSMLETQKKIAACLAGQQLDQKATCPDCGLTLADASELSAERLTQWDESLKDLERDRETALQEITRLSGEWNTYNNFMVAKTTALEKGRTEVNQMEHSLALPDNQPMMPEEEAIATATALNDAKTRLPMLKQSVDQHTRDLRAKLTEKNNYQSAQTVIMQGRTGDFTPVKGKELLEARTAKLKEWEDWQAPYGELVQTNSFMEHNARRRKELVEQKQELERKLEEPMPAEVMALSVPLEGNIEAIKTELKNRNDVRQQAVGRLEQAQKNYERVNGEYQDLRRREATDAGKRKLIEDLKVLRSILEEDGLPMAVVRHHFEHLAALTQEALLQLDANFAILIDRDKPLAFKFIRLDEPVQYEMPMNKLSGGQRVRLCIAFLMAVQKRLVREVGLLVLDEPSVHMDPAGADSLAELLLSLQSQLKNTEMQVWVADHSPGLETCFNSVLRLANDVSSAPATAQ